MTAAKGGITSIATAGWWKAGISAPAKPGVTVADDGTGTSATLTIDGDAGVTHTAYYYRRGDPLQTGGSRSGDGTIQITGLTEDVFYEFFVVSADADGVRSLPSDPVGVRVTSGTDEIADLVAQAVVDELNAGSWSQTFTALRSRLPLYELKDLDTLRVTVLPGTPDIAGLSRSRNREDYPVQIGIQKRYSDETNVVIDPLAKLAREIKDAFRRKRLSNYSDAICVAIANEPLYDADVMRESRTFMGLITLTFRIFR